MILFWIVGMTIVVAVSFLLARRSMNDFKDTHVTNVRYGLYLVRNINQLNENTLISIHQLILNINGIISFEKLTKGGERVLVIYCPTVLKTQIPELELLELEDYLEPETDQILGWTVAAKNNSKKALIVKSEFLNLLDLKDSQKFFLQVVCQPVSIIGEFQITMRALVVDPSHNDRIELAKKMTTAIFDATGLIKQARQQVNITIYEDYMKRVFVPKEVVKNILKTQEILSLIK